jgi:monoamine oxidase
MTTPPDRDAKAGGIRRRTFVGAAAGATIAGSLAGPARAQTAPSRSRSADVVVVGAGLSGIAAAKEIVKAGRSVVVLEAQDHVGGRTLSTPITSNWAMERGAEGLQDTSAQTVMTAFAREVGIDPFRKVPTGNNVYYRNGSRQLYDRNGPSGRIPPDLIGIVDDEPGLVLLEQMAAQVPTDKPWTAANAEQWDSKTFETWKLENMRTDNGRFLLDLGTNIFLACRPRDVSLLESLALIARFDVKPAPGHSKTQQEIETTGVCKFPYGAQQVCVRHAQQLGMGDNVLLNSPVRAIQQDQNGVRVLTDDQTFNAKHAIVAMPPFITRYIAYDPPLPPSRASLLQRFPMGSLFKFHAVYDKPWWREAGLTGEAFADTYPVKFCSDGTPPDGSPGVLFGFILGQDARLAVQQTPGDRRGAVLGNLATFFGDEALYPSQYLEKSWSEDIWSRGAFDAFTPPGVLLDFGEDITAPFGRVHWSGTEAALKWTASMEGAVRAGMASAQEVLGAL